jgi:hypothetical protein
MGFVLLLLCDNLFDNTVMIYLVEIIRQCYILSIEPQCNMVISADSYNIIKRGKDACR